MSRQYDDPIEVRRRDPSTGAPREFLWHDRLYLVRTVLLSWIEAAPWWRGDAAIALLSGTDLSGTDLSGTDVRGEPAAATLTAPPPSPEREMWRVEASHGRAFALGVFDLAFDGTAGSWSLARAHD